MPRPRPPAWEHGHPALPIGEHHRQLGLLRHHLRDPDAVGIELLIRTRRLTIRQRFPGSRLPCASHQDGKEAAMACVDAVISCIAQFDRNGLRQRSVRSPGCTGAAGRHDAEHQDLDLEHPQHRMVGHGRCGRGNAVVLIHGFGANTNHWPQPAGVGELAPTYAIDLLGFGRSDQPRLG